jgi:FkbM family methyltransferase
MGLSTTSERLWNWEFNSAWGRALLGFVFRPGKRYLLFCGPLAGLTLQYRQDVNFHVMLGLWETKSYRFLNRVFQATGFFTKQTVIADLGANLGYFSLWANRLAKQSKGRVFAFEPSPTILPLLEQNLAQNSAAQVKVVPKACGDVVGHVDFFIGSHHHVSSLDEAWASQGTETRTKIRAASTTLDHFFFESEFAGALPDFIKIDVEGGAVFALPGMSRCIEGKRPLIWIESHSPAEDRAIGKVLESHQYNAFRLQTKTLVTEPSLVHPHPNGVWGSLLLFPQEKTDEFQRLGLLS